MARKTPASRKRTPAARTDAADKPLASGGTAVVRSDSYSSALTGIGTARDKRTYASVSVWGQMSYQQAEDLWRGDDMAAKVIEEPAREMTRAWIDVHVDPGDEDEAKADPGKAKEQAEAVIKELSRLKAKTRFRDAVMKQRAYGGAAILLGADDGVSDLSKPLNVKGLKSISFLTVFDAFEVYPRTYYNDPEVEQYGEPETYWVYPQGVPGLGLEGVKPTLKNTNVVHESRLLRIEGVTMSRRLMVRNRGWPDSALVRVQQVLADFGISWDGAAHLLQDFSQGVFKMRGLADAAAAGAEGEELIRKRLEDVELGRSVVRAIVLDAGDGTSAPSEEFQRQATPIAGLAEMLDRFCNRLAAAADMPVTRLMGQSPAGLNATGQQDENWWFDRIAGQQEEILLDPLTRLVELVFSAKEGPTKGKVPENWSILFKPLKQETAQQRAQRMQSLASAWNALIQAGVLFPEEVATSAFGGDEFSDHITINKDRRKEIADERKILTLTPADLQALSTLWQGAGIAFSEFRERLRKAGIATLDDEKAKEEIAENPPGPPGMGPGQGQGGDQFGGDGQQQTDENGNPLDENGNPVDEYGNPIEEEEPYPPDEVSPDDAQADMESAWGYGKDEGW